jgi:hypothetical protein
VFSPQQVEAAMEAAREAPRMRMRAREVPVREAAPAQVSQVGAGPAADADGGGR